LHKGGLSGLVVSTSEADSRVDAIDDRTKDALASAGFHGSAHLNRADGVGSLYNAGDGLDDLGLLFGLRVSAKRPSTHPKISDLAVEVRERADMLHQLVPTNVAECL
jgi:cell shape-determining protein MreC